MEMLDFHPRQRPGVESKPGDKALELDENKEMLAASEAAAGDPTFEGVTSYRGLLSEISE